MATYTLAEIKARADIPTRDSGHSLISSANKTIIINDKVREFVIETGCNRNRLIFSLADGTTSGTLEYSLDGTSPTITYTDVEGWPYYTISDCDRIDGIFRWKGTSDDPDGCWRELSPANESLIDIMGLLDGDNSVPTHFQTLNFDKFRILPELSSDAYTIKFMVKYRKSVTDMSTDAGVPSVPLKYRRFLISGVVAEIFKARGDERWQIYEAEFQSHIARIKREIDKDFSGRAPKLSRRYVGAGG